MLELGQKRWKVTFQLDDDRILEMILDEIGTVLECDPPQYEKMLGYFTLLNPEDYYEGDKVDFFDKEHSLKIFPYKIQSIEEKEVDDA